MKQGFKIVVGTIFTATSPDLVNTGKPHNCQKKTTVHFQGNQGGANIFFDKKTTTTNGRDGLVGKNGKALLALSRIIQRPASGVLFLGNGTNQLHMNHVEVTGLVGHRIRVLQRIGNLLIRKENTNKIRIPKKK